MWGTLLNRLQKMQSRAARIITESDYDTPAEPLLNERNWKSPMELIRYDTAVIMFKCLNNLAPGYLSIFESLEDLTPAELRNSETDLLPPKLDTATGQRSFPIMELRPGITLMRIKKSILATRF